MALVFSKVTIDNDGESIEFLVSGSPRNENGLKGWVAYEDFIKTHEGMTTAQIQPYSYGSAQPYKATPEEVAYMDIMNAIMRTANENAELLKTLKLHIGMGLDMGESEDESLDLQIKIAEIDAEFKAMLNAISSDTVEAFDEQRAKELMDEKSQLQQQLASIAERKQKRENTKSRLDEIFTILDGLRNRPMEYDDRLVRQILECVVVESKERIKVVFIGGLEITETLINNI